MIVISLDPILPPTISECVPMSESCPPSSLIGELTVPSADTVSNSCCQSE